MEAPDMEPTVVSVREFRGNDPGYLAWIAAHPGGYVINIRRDHNPTDARLHAAGCRWISGENPRGGPWTGRYVKVCADALAALEQWASEHARGSIKRCGTCHPARDPSTPRTAPVTATRPRRAVGVIASTAGHYAMRGPEAARPVVEAWTEDYVHFQNRPAWQDKLRAEILDRVGQLVAARGEVLHATFFGPLPPRTDVENLLFYNFGSFASASRFGIRFELGGEVPLGPEGGQYGFGYRYELAPRAGAYARWSDGRALASFDWVELDAFGGEKICEQVWLTLARAPIAVADPPRASSMPFSARFELRPPMGRTRGLAGLVKGIFDGAICAFQAHTDPSDLPELAARAATNVRATPEEIASLLMRRDRAVLGAVPRLLHRRGSSVQWSPADDFCVAGDLLAAQPSGACWAIKGEIIEIAPRAQR
jgi:hypothetical protein